MGLWVEKFFYFEPAESISIFIPRVFNLNLLRLKLTRTNISLWAIYIVQIVLHMQTLNTLINNKWDIFSRIKSDPNFQNVNEVILVGDRNINSLNHTGLFLDTLLLKLVFLPLITLPTRTAGSSATLLDHIVTNIAEDTYDSGIILSDISDHFPVFYIRHYKDKSVKVNLVKAFRKFDASSISRFKTMLANKNWVILLNTDQETSINVFFETIENCLCPYFLKRKYFCK